MIKIKIWERKDSCTLKFFGFLSITLRCFPWQESEAHRKHRDWSKDLPEKLRITKIPYAIGWTACGDSFYRAIGVKLTSRDVRIDVWIGIIWISWLPFNPAKPRK